MIENIYYHISKSFCPYHNLALEELLAKSVQDGEAIMYLWQNADTVVIGKHQNAYSECNYEIMKKDNISLARRKTGGGAVFHDDKNLNFTFINRKQDYDLKRNQNIICKAVESFGLDCQVSGRNDITYDGKKFSGNAFFNGKDFCIHHGTIMLDVDLTRLERYLNVDKSKLLNKGVASVRARVVNLKTVIPDINIERMQKALINSFEEVYGLAVKEYDTNRKQKHFDNLIAFYKSEEFLLGKYPVILARQRKPYGELMITQVNDQLTIFSDCLDVDIIDYINQQLKQGQKKISIKDGFSQTQKQIVDDLNTMLLEAKKCKE